MGGAVDVDIQRVGNRDVNLATVYATAEPGIAEHEVVHAYCVQAFGCTGPDWYSEGMAQMVSHYHDRDHGVSWPTLLLESLRVHEPPAIEQTVGSGQFTAPLTALFRGPQTGDARQDGLGLVQRPLRWRIGDDQTVRDARQSYCWSLALCHFLSHNANYNQRFRALGQSYLQRKDVSFDREFASVADRMAFEYRLYLAQLANGYRADLCSWDWSKEFLHVERAHTLVAAVDAHRGYQASGLMVVEGQAYDFVSAGTWQTHRRARA